MQMAILHRPLFPSNRPEENACQPKHRMMGRDRESIWISYCPVTQDGLRMDPLALFNSHVREVSPLSASKEALKIGCGTPPILTHHGWLIIDHGVKSLIGTGRDGHPLC